MTKKKEISFGTSNECSNAVYHSKSSLSRNGPQVIFNNILRVQL